MIKLTDYIVKQLVEYGISHVFLVTGGGAMHLNDSFGKCKEITVICNHHEQACAIAAEGYARTTGKLGVVNVTTGPGGLNTLTGVMGQWTDSVPVLYISGQVKYETTVYSCRDLELRQLGDQEVPIVDIVKPVTKYAVVLDNPGNVKKVLDKALYLATHGRPGPVWIDIPMNVQGAMIDETTLSSYDEKEDNIEFGQNQITQQCLQVLELLKNAERPVIIAGHGIRIAKVQELFLKIIEKIRIPVLTTFNGFDLIATSHQNYIGRIGTLGDRAGNFALQNSDLILSIGSRNNVRQVSYNWRNFGRCAKKIIIDIDPAELRKPTITPDIGIHTDIALFLNEFARQLGNYAFTQFTDWTNWCLVRKKKYPVVLEEYKNTNDKVNPYYFVQALTEIAHENSIIIAGNGTACVSLFQAGIVKKGQRIFWNSGCAAMGYDLPAAVGACFGNGKKDVLCLAGDGSLQMNIQELATVAYHKLPVKLFYFNNGGYISIKQTQDNFFNGRRIGSDEQSGIGFPDIIKIAQAYGLQTEIIYDQKNMHEKIMNVLKTQGPVVCEVKLLHEYIFAPKLSSEKKPDGRMVSKPLEDMYPFLDRDEFRSNMIVPVIEE